jgi:hypothetical protein
MSRSDWRLISTQSTALSVGVVAPIVVGAGFYNFGLTNGHGTNYNASYRGAGGGAGVGLRVPASRIASFLMDYYMPTVRSLINSVGSQDVYLSNLYKLIPSELTANNLNKRLSIYSVGAEIGLNGSGSIFLWEDDQQYEGIHPQTARLGDFTPTTRPRFTAIALGVGIGVGLVGASATGTLCFCDSFAPAT